MWWVSIDELIRDLLQEPLSISDGILNFYALWHSPCVMMNECFRELSRSYPSLSFVQVFDPSHHECQAEDLPDLSESLEISSVRTFVFFLGFFLLFLLI